MAKTKAAESKVTAAAKKYMKPSEVATFGIGLFGVALLTGWMPDYTTTFFADFAFKGKGFDSASLSHIVEVVFLIAGFVGAICELVIGVLVDRTKTKLGKAKSLVGFGAIPLAIISMLVFVAPNTTSFGLASVWMIVIYCLYTAVSCAVESPSNCFGALCSPNPAERSSAISIASFLRSVGQSGGQVVIIVVGALMKALMGQQQFKNAEGQGIDLIISTAICALGMIIFVMIFFANNKERVPYTSEKVSLLESIKLVCGADSVCLFHLLRELQEPLGFSLLAGHVNHNLRGAEAGRDAAFAENLCREYDVPFYLYSCPVEKIAKEKHLSTEEAGRAARQEVFAACAKEQGAVKIALAHHQDDVAETMLHHLARGTSLAGLAS